MAAKVRAVRATNTQACCQAEHHLSTDREPPCPVGVTGRQDLRALELAAFAQNQGFEALLQGSCRERLALALEVTRRLRSAPAQLVEARLERGKLLSRFLEAPQGNLL